MTVFSHTSVSSKERNTVRLPLASNEHINAFTGAAITNYSGNISNGIVEGLLLLITLVTLVMVLLIHMLMNLREPM
jgi:hypothetical protein